MTAIIAIFVVLFTIVFFHELGHFLAAKIAGVTVLEFGIGFPPRLFAFRFKGTEYSLNWIFFGAFVKLAGEKDEAIEGGFATKSAPVRFLVSAAGPLSNFILAYFLFTIGYLVPTDVIAGGTGLKVLQVAPDSPAAINGIQTRDIILKIGGKEVTTFEELHAATQASLGRETDILLQREGKEILVRLTPRISPPRGEGAIGVRLGWDQVKTERRRLGLGPSLIESGKNMQKLPELLGHFFSQVFSSPEGTLVGPLGAAQITGQVAKYGLGPLLALAASLSIGIAIFNLFPIPPLDGGGMLITVVEGFRRGRMLSSNTRKIIYIGGTTLLVMLFVMITYNDILRFIRGDSLLP